MLKSFALDELYESRLIVNQNLNRELKPDQETS